MRAAWPSLCLVLTTPRRSLGRAVSAVAALLLLLFSPRTFAGTRPELSVRVDTQTVGVGEDVTVTLQASTSEGALADAQPGAIRGFSLVGSSSGPTTSVTIMNGRMTQKHGLSARFTLRADRVGSWILGPASVAVDGVRFNASPITVKVVPPGSAPPRPRGNDPFGSPFSTLDPFKGLFDFNDLAPRQPDIPVDPRLSLDASRGAIAFLHAVIDKTSAVVGEQLTLSVYEYVDLSENDPDLTDIHEATANDFVKRSLSEDDSARVVGNARIGGRYWGVKLVRRWALFPLKGGDLDIGPMSVSLVRSRVAGGSVRESETLRVHVTEPPLDGRPPGYVVGDTGNFGLTAEVTPREVEQGGAVGVNVELSGTGNLPSAITPPARAGLEWLEPEVREKVGATASDRFGGTRTFSFVLRLHREGDVDLGDVTLPFYNPDSHAYGVARASLGKVKVRPNPNPAPTEAAFDPFAGLPAPRAERAGAKAPSAHLSDAPAFWWSLGMLPVSYAVFAGAWAAGSSLRKRRYERKASPETELKTRMAEATVACAGPEPSSGYAAIVRALEMGTLARLGVNVRDAQRGQIAHRLVQAGVEAAAATYYEDLLRAAETARFSFDQEAAGAMKGRWEEARHAILALRGGK